MLSLENEHLKRLGSSNNKNKMHEPNFIPFN